MAALPAGHDVPWQRVINSQGKVSPRRNGDGDLIQRLLLEAEGVQFDARGRVDLVRYSWEAVRSGVSAGNTRAAPVI